LPLRGTVVSFAAILRCSEASLTLSKLLVLALFKDFFVECVDVLIRLDIAPRFLFVVIVFTGGQGRLANARRANREKIGIDLAALLPFF